MIDGVQLKICGLTTPGDAECAAGAGADALGFILYPKSPRYLPLERYRAIAPLVPEGPKRVAVLVEPGTAELDAAIAAGFDRFQIHFERTTPLERVREWSELVGRDRLWLAPKLPPGTGVVEEWIPLAGGFLLDTFHEGGFGGSGKTGDWEGFRRHQARWPETAWVLAGGLGPGNVGEALAASGARFVDVNSGVEVSPGIKDHEKVRQVVRAIRDAKT